MSYKLYYDDSYMKKFTATVISCTQTDKGRAIVLDKTAFYPEGGGQPRDRGVITAGDRQIQVNDVREKGGEIIHYCSSPIEPGSCVEGEIDWERRFDFMQQHTGEHMLSGIVHRLFGYNNVGFHMNEKEVTVDFDGPLTRRDIRQVMEESNRCVWENQPVIASFPDNVKDLDYRSKKELEGEVRIVFAGNADTCACCGTHTSTTSAAGPIAVTSFSAYKCGTRLVMHSGKRAVDILMRRNRQCYDISHMLSAPVDTIQQAVAARLEENEKLKSALASSQSSLMEVWAQGRTAENGRIIEIKKGLSSAQIQSFALLLAKKADTAIVVSDTDGAKICIVSPTLDTNALGRHISGIFGGKGGGKKGIYQGFLTQMPDMAGLAAAADEFEKNRQ